MGNTHPANWYGTWLWLVASSVAAVALVITVGAVLYLGLFPGQVINALQAKPSVTLSLR